MTLCNYISGMPVVLNVRLVNSYAKLDRPNAGTVEVSRAWAKNVTWNLWANEGRAVPVRTVGPRFYIGEGLSTTSTVELFRRDLFDEWTIPAEDTYGLSGEYRIVAKWHEISPSDEIVLKFRPATNDLDRASVLLRQASERIGAGEAKVAVELLAGVIEKYGKMFSDRDLCALLLLGDAFAALDRTQESIDCYEGFVAVWEKTNGRMSGPVLRTKIGRQKMKLEKEKDRGLRASP